MRFRREPTGRSRLALVVLFVTFANGQQRECNEVKNVFKTITDCVTSIATQKSSFRVSSQRQGSTSRPVRPGRRVLTISSIVCIILCSLVPG